METRLFSALSILVLLFAVPVALADNGDGYVVNYKPDTSSTDSDVDLWIEFTNDATDGSCLDEIIITAPGTWTGTASVDLYDRGGYTATNEADAGDGVNLVPDFQSVRIVPYLPLCPGETVNIEIDGLVAPSSYEVAIIEIYTSDQDSNAGPSEIRRLIGNSPVIYVTEATQMKIEYFHITGFSDTGFNGRAWGAWARLTELAIASDGGNLEIWMETGSTDTKIFDAFVGPGTEWIVMDYSAWDTNDNGVNLQNGYLADQAAPRAFYITYSGSSIQLLGSSDEILDDDELVDSGLVGARGTIIQANSNEVRKILVQLIDDSGFDVNEQIPVGIDPHIGAILEVAPYMTDTDGNAYFTFQSECQAGVADVVISTDPLITNPNIRERVGIKPDVPYSYEVTVGDGAEVPAGESQMIEVTVYDWCGNVISNTDQVLVEFDYLTTDCGSMNKLAQTPGGPSHDHEEEYTGMGLAQVYLNTDCQLCTHEVQIVLDWGLGGEVIELYGIPGPPAKMQVTIDEAEIQADECVDALIEVTDECGNRVEVIYDPHTGHAQQWESMVWVKIIDPLVVDQPGWASSSSTYITSSDFREEENHGSWLKGKLNNGAGMVEICGCMGLGTFNVIAESDTIEDGEDTVSVINADPDCIETETEDQLLLCEESAELDIAVKDVCGNYWTNQDCLSGPATYCVDIELSGSCGEDDAHLSTNTVCIDVGAGGLGYADPPVTIFRDTDDCCQLGISVSNGQDCCEDFEDLPQCAPTSLLFHGAPSFMTTQFYQTRINPFTQEEQLHDQMNMEGATEVVSEEVLDLFTVYDQCGHIVKDFDGTVDVRIDGEDCLSHYQVDHPLELDGGLCVSGVTVRDFSCEELLTEADCITANPQYECQWHEMTRCPLDKPWIIKKLVMENCAPPTEKQWLPLEKDDMVVDKLAFDIQIPIPVAGLWAVVYMENEMNPGYQPGQDRAVGKAPVNPKGPTIMELKDSNTPYWDDQRQGGVLIRASDSRDFYVVLVSAIGVVACGDYTADFLWYQDYNSPDITEWGAGWPDPDGDEVIEVNDLGGFVEDFCKDSDNYNWIEPQVTAHPVCGPGTQDSRNDDYGHSTPYYGFGDRYLYNLKFSEGQAWMKFRDLVAETVEVHVLDVYESGSICHYEEMDIELDEEVRPNPEVIEFISQPATQIKLINHDEPPKTVSCSEIWDEDVNAYLFNIQTTDGFDNPHAKELEIELEFCLKMPFSDDVEGLVASWCRMNGHHFGFTDAEECEKQWMDIDYCYTKEDLKDFIMDTDFGQYMGEALFGDYFGDEFMEWVDAYFEEAKVEFWDIGKNPLPYDAYGHQVVMTDGNGQAQVYVTANKAGGYKIIARPLALDGDTAYVRFNEGAPAKLDLMALPSFGVPADGEQEAMLLLRAFDECGNIVYEPIYDVTVGVTQGEQVYISQDFEGKNNYDGDVTGTLWCNSWLGLTNLAVLSDLPQTATIMASSGEMESDITQIDFQGAPVKLAITEIVPSDRLPGDGETGAWVTVQVQDKNGNRVTGYKGAGYLGDPGDPWGFTDFLFEDICFDLDEAGAMFPIEPGTEIYPWEMDIDSRTFGWINWHKQASSMYCGDLLFGEGKVYVVLDKDECEHGGTIEVKVWDAPEYQGQEFNENGIPISDHATQLDPDMGEIDFVDPATQWNIWADKEVVLADGETYTLVTIQVENQYMDVRQAVDANIFVGGEVDSGAWIAWISNYDGLEAPDPTDPDTELTWDSLNPTSVRAVTSPVTGRAYLLLKSSEAGAAEVTVTGGQAYVCDKSRDKDYQCNSDNDCIEVYNFYNCHYTKNKDLTPKTMEIEFLDVADEEIFLNTGWNFISTPYALDDPDVEGVFADVNSDIDVILGWDADTQNWVLLTAGDNIEPLEGYWVKMNAPGVITLVYDTNPGFPVIPTKEVKPGWNAVGLTWNTPTTVLNTLISISNSYSQLIGWIAGLQSYDLPVANTGGSGPMENGGYQMQPKMGYWIWVTATDDLAGLTALGS